MGDSVIARARAAEMGLRIAQLTGLGPESRARADLTAYASKVLAELQAEAPEGARQYFRKAITLAEIGQAKPFLPWGAFTGGPPPAVALLWRPVVENGGEGYWLFSSWDLPMFLTALGPAGFLASLAIAPDAKEHAENVIKRAVAVGEKAGDMLSDAAKAATDAAKAGFGLLKWAVIGGVGVVVYKVFSKKGK